MMMKSVLSVVVALLFVASWESPTVQAFSVVPRAVVGITHVRPLSPTVLKMAKPAIAKRSDLDKGPAKKMDGVIFNFNKILIDSVYDLIW